MKKTSPENVTEAAGLSGEVRVLPSTDESSGGSARVGTLVGVLVLFPVLYVGGLPVVIVALEEKNLLPDRGLVFGFLSAMVKPLVWLHDHFTLFRDYIDWLSKLF